jgi:hypothetical protein
MGLTQFHVCFRERLPWIQLTMHRGVRRLIAVVIRCVEWMITEIKALVKYTMAASTMSMTVRLEPNNKQSTRATTLTTTVNFLTGAATL